MANFDLAHTKTSKHEAGYSSDSADRGGETWAGISRVNWPKWAGWARVDSAKAILGLTKDTAHAHRKALDAALGGDAELAKMVAACYKEHYWDTLTLDGEGSQAIAEKTYDIAVNMGVGVAKDFLSKARHA